MSFWTYKNICCCFIRHKHKTYIQSFIYTCTFFFDLHWGRHITTRNKHCESIEHVNTQSTSLCLHRPAYQRLSFQSLSLLSTSLRSLCFCLLSGRVTQVVVWWTNNQNVQNLHIRRFWGEMFFRVVNQKRTLRPSGPTNPHVDSSRC